MDKVQLEDMCGLVIGKIMSVAKVDVKATAILCVAFALVYIGDCIRHYTYTHRTWGAQR